MAKSTRDIKKDSDFPGKVWLIVLFFPFFFIYYLVKWIVRYLRGMSYNVRQAKRDLKKIDKMDGREFEVFLSRMYSALGYSVTLTRATRDFGADLIIEREGIRTAVQAKLLSTGAIANKAVSEVYGAKNYYSATGAIVVTNRGYTDAAKKLAEGNSVELIDRDGLLELIISGRRALP